MSYGLMQTYPVRTMLVIICLSVFPSVVLGNSVSAKRGPYNGSVHVKGGPANSTGDIQQTDANGNFVSLGKTVTTDATGEGRAVIRNTRGAGGLECDRQVRVVFPGGAICGPSTVKWNNKIYSVYVPGIVNQVEATLDQDVTDAEGMHIDTWEDGAMWILRLKPTEASWINAGAYISSSEGDLAASLVSVTSSEVTVQIVHDPSPLTPNSIIIFGLRVNVPSTSTLVLHPEIGLSGSVKTYVDGVLSGGETTQTTTFVDAIEIEGAKPVPTLGALGLAMLTGLLLLVGARTLRRAHKARWAER